MRIASSYVLNIRAPRRAPGPVAPVVPVAPDQDLDHVQAMEGQEDMDPASDPGAGPSAHAACTNEPPGPPAAAAAEVGAAGAHVQTAAVVAAMRLEMQGMRDHLAEVGAALNSALAEMPPLAEQIAELRRAVQAHQEILTQVVGQLRSSHILPDV